MGNQYQSELLQRGKKGVGSFGFAFAPEIKAEQFLEVISVLQSSLVQSSEEWHNGDNFKGMDAMRLRERNSTEQNTGKQHIYTAIKALIFALTAAGLFYLMEFYEHNPFVEVRQQAQWFNIVLFELFGWGLFCLFGSGRVALRVLAAVAMVFGLLNHYVVVFRSNPLVPWDFLSYRTAISVMDNYNYTPTVRVVVVTLIFLGIIGFLQFFHFKWKARIYWRMIPLAAVCVGVYWFAGALQDEKFQTRHYLYPFLFTPAYMTQVNGMAVTFTMNMAYIQVDKPDGYSRQKAEQILEAYADEPDGEEESDYPNIIVIMDEAFSDLAVLGDLETSEDYMPFVHSLQQGAENTITGYLNVSVCGGNTANSEFEFLTGNTMAYLPAGSVPYQQYIKSKMPSLAGYLKELGYVTYAMHPYNAGGWDRDTVYPLLGFDESYFLSDYRQVTYLRKYVSDASDFDNLIRVYENKPQGQPAFIFNVTMQNHGGYTDTYENFESDVKALSADSAALDQYLSLVKRTDTAFEQLLNYFDAQDEKTVVLFFGDHQPSNAVTKYVQGADTQNEQRYEVPYVIWANYDISEESGADTSANYLAAQVLKAAGVPTSPYHNFLLELEEYYPIYSAVRTECSRESEELLSDYRMLQYYLLFDYGR